MDRPFVHVVGSTAILALTVAACVQSQLGSHNQTPSPSTSKVVIPSPSADHRQTAAKADPNPTVTNRKRDFSGLNNGDFVALWWEQDKRASEYVISRAFASDGPWEELARVPLSSGTDFTSEAKLKQLCYRIEALNASGNVIRSYEPICIPIFVEVKK